MKFRLLFTLFLFIISHFYALSAPLTKAKALERLETLPSSIKLSSDATPVYIAKKGALNTWFAFNLPQGGFAIVAANDVAQPLLGYSPTGSFDCDALPPALSYWLDIYSNEIATASINNISPTKYRAMPRQAISPMIATRWDQGAPYNIECPLYNGKSTFTGCVATAMAQVMKYHEYPSKGNGAVSYIWNGENLSLDFSTTTFDWSNMDNFYNASSSDASKSAVANLMKACGYAVNSVYGTVATNASVYLWAPSLINYFGYAPSSQPVNRLYYTLSQWEEMIYNSLKEGCPVLYSGIGAGLGHAFVCDGYSSDGYFHFNWGWSGLSDGYFLLSALDPSALGTGGGAGGFNSGQIAVINAKPNFDGAESNIEMGILDGAEISYSNVSGNFTLTGGCMNLSNKPIEAKVGFEILSPNGDTYYAGTTNSYATYELQNVTSSFARKTTSNLPDGTYSVFPSFAFQKDDSEHWKRMLVPVNMKPYWTLTMLNGKGTLTPQSQNLEVSVTNFRATTAIHNNSDFKIAADITNNGNTEFMYNIYAAIYDVSGNLLVRSLPIPVDIPVGESIAFDALVYPADKLKDNTVNIKLQVQNQHNNSEYFDISPVIQVNVLPTVADSELKATEFYVENASNVDPMAVNLHISATCSKGYYANPIRIWARKEGDQSWGQMMLTPFLFLEQDQSEQITFTFQLPSAIIGTKYSVIANYIKGSSQAWFGSCEFTVGETQGVESAENDQSNPIYFNMQGVRILNPTPGIYIVRRGKKIAKEIIK